MSFREKIHWVAFAAMALAFGWYFLSYPWDIARTQDGVMASAGMLVPTVIIIIITMSLATAFFAIRMPGEVNLKEDERDLTIHLRGTHLAYYPLVVGVWINLAAVFFQISPAVQLNLLLATVVVAELVRIGAQIFFYRRGH